VCGEGDCLGGGCAGEEGKQSIMVGKEETKRRGSKLVERNKDRQTRPITARKRERVPGAGLGRIPTTSGTASAVLLVAPSPPSSRKAGKTEGRQK
jgi:alcohol dehydrogenase class IV